jgi:hypothetical protein
MKAKYLFYLTTAFYLLVSCNRTSDDLDPAFRTNKTFIVLYGGPFCGSITYRDRIGNDLNSAIDSLVKLRILLLEGLTAEEYYIDKEMITVDFNYDDRKFYSIGFRRKNNDMYIFSISDVIDSNGNCFNILWCDD